MPQNPQNPFTQEENLKQWLENDKHYTTSYSLSLDEYKETARVKSAKFNFREFWTSWKLTISMSTLSGAVAFALVVILFLTPNSQLPTPLQGVFPGAGPAVVKASEIEINAVSQDSLGVLPDTKFLIESKKDLSADEMKRRISVDPVIDFNIEKALLRAGQYNLVPSKPLDPAQTYKFNFQTEDEDAQGAPSKLGWAFQVQDDLQVLQTLPKNKATNVPLNSGVEIIFNAPKISLKEDKFEISPKVTGRFETKDSQVTFIPESLQPKTIYTVKIKAGIGAEGSNIRLAEDFAFRFETTGSEDSFDTAGFFDTLSSFSPKSPIYLNYYGSQNSKPGNLQVYKFNQVEDLAVAANQGKINSWANFSAQNNVDVSKLNKVAEYDNAYNSDSSKNYFLLPDGLESGYYLFNTVENGKQSQAFVQITDLGVTATYTSGEAMFWLTDVKTKGVIANSDAIIEGASKNQVKSNSEGVFTLDLEKVTSSEKLTIVRVGDRAVVLNDSISYKYDSTTTYSNWAYLSTDRPAYRTVDTINYWGFLPNVTQADYELKLVSGYKDYRGNEIIVEAKDINLTDKSTFSGNFKLKQISSGDYTMELFNKKTKNVVKVIAIRIENFSKPLYQINFKTDKDAYIKGETIKLDGQVNFYSGGPVSNLDLKLTEYSEDPITTFKTDAQGKFKAELVANFIASGYPSLEPIYKTFNVSPLNPEESQIIESYSFLIFPKPTKLVVNSKLKSDDKTKTVVDFNLYKVDTNQNSPDTIYNSFDGDPLSNVKINIELTEYGFQKTEIGRIYDYYSKQNIPQFRYDKVEIGKVNYEVTTNDLGQANLEFTNKVESNYELKATYIDGSGINETTSIIYFSYLEESDRSVSIDGVTYNQSFKDGEKVNLTLNSTRKELLQPGVGNKYLLVLAKDKVIQTIYSEKPEFSFDYKESYAPGIYIMALVFDGQSYAHTFQEMLNFNYSDKELNIDLKTDKNSYSPKEKSSLSLKVTDKAGNPQNTKVFVSVADESIFDLYTEPAKILSELYTNRFAGFVDVGSSLSDPSPQAIQRGGLGAGGGEAAARFDFKDSIYSKEINTDANGEAKIELDLPDNLTTWRITAEAVTPDLKAGTAIKKIQVGKPFFVDLIANETYLSSDSPIIKIRAFGGDTNNDISYEVQLDGKKLEGLILENRNALVSLGKMTPGTHIIKVTAQNGDLSDILERRINVLNSYQTSPKIEKYTYNEGLQLNPVESSYAKVTVTDAGIGRYYNILQEFKYQVNDRLDQQISAAIVTESLAKYFNESSDQNKVTWTKFKNENGGLSIYPYSDSDIETSVQAAMSGLQDIDKPALTKYFQTLLNDSKESRDRKIKALLGLSALGEYNLITLRALSENIDLSIYEKLDLALTLALSGDTEKARSMYSELLKTKVESNGGIMLKIDESLEKNVEITSLVALLGSVLEEQSSQSLLDFLQTQYSQSYKFRPYLVVASLNWMARLNQNSVIFSYDDDGQVKEVKLDQSSPTYQLLVESEKLQKLKFKTISGQINIIVSSQSSELKPGMVLSSEQAKVAFSRQYLDPITLKPKTEFKAGDILRVDFVVNVNNQLPDRSCYLLTDYLSSNIKAISNISLGAYTDGIRYPYIIEGQKVTFCVSKGETKLGYLARVINIGEYTAEGASIEINDNGQKVVIPDQNIK